MFKVVSADFCKLGYHLVFFGFQLLATFLKIGFFFKQGVQTFFFEFLCLKVNF